MSKKMSFILILAFSALFLFPLNAGATARTKPAAAVTTSMFAFTSIITKGENKGSPLTGYLTLQTAVTGLFKGDYRTAEGTKTKVDGTIQKNGDLAITFYDAHKVAFITGQGTPDKQHQYSGPFQVMKNHKQVSSGIWSALSIEPKMVMALAFQGQVTSGKDKGLFLPGAMIIEKKHMTGIFLQANAAKLTFKATLQNGGEMIKVVFDTQHISGTGKLVRNPANAKDKGYKGTFTGPAANDRGQWEAYFFIY